MHAAITYGEDSYSKDLQTYVHGQSVVAKKAPEILPLPLIFVTALNVQATT